MNYIRIEQLDLDNKIRLLSIQERLDRGISHIAAWADLEGIHVGQLEKTVHRYSDGRVARDIVVGNRKVGYRFNDEVLEVYILYPIPFQTVPKTI